MQKGCRTGINPPWEENPFTLVNWWDMAKFSASSFCLICAHLRGTAEKWDKDRNALVSGDSLRSILTDLKFVMDHCERAGLKNAAAYIGDQMPLLSTPNINFEYIKDVFGNLNFQIMTEMRRAEFLVVDKPKFYGESPLFDSFVTDVFSQLTYDVVEAGNCLALNRTTACVFHLMRIMEFGVQRFGEKLGVPLVDETVWQKIMDQVNSRIKDMPEKPAAKKRIKERYADIAGHLYNVKVAWRNPVMHPKRTYTPEEAERLFDAVKKFHGDFGPISQTQDSCEIERLTQSSGTVECYETSL